MKTLVEEGNSLEHTAIDVMVSGEVVEFADSVGVLSVDLAIGESGTVAMKGVYQLPKAAALALTPGQRVYYSAANDEVTATNTDIPAGIVWAAALAADTTVNVSINV